MLENFSRSSGAVMAVAADVHSPYKKKSILRMYVGVYTCFALFTGDENQKKIANTSAGFLFKVPQAFWIIKESVLM